MANTQLCPDCKKLVAFHSDVFGSICSHCGLVLDGSDLLVSTNDFHTGNAVASTSSHSTQNGSKPLTWIQREAKKLLTLADGSDGQINPPAYVTATISAILSHYESANLTRQCTDLFYQVKVLSRALYDEYQKEKANGAIILPQAKVRQKRAEAVTIEDKDFEAISQVVLLHGEETDTKVAIACSFSVLKRHIDAITLESVCQAAGSSSLSSVADILRYIESLFGGTHMLEISRDDPSIHLTGHIALLCDSSTERFFEAQEMNSIKAANIPSLSFLDLVMDLCNLCARNGLNNRSAKVSSRKDLSICAWTLLTIAMESASGRLCREGKMAESMALLSDLHNSKGINVSSGKTTVSELIKKRYVEISRMLTWYMQYLPWVSDDCSANGAVKLAKKGKGKANIAQIKSDVTSIKPLPRKTVSRYLTDVLTLSHHIEKEMRAKGTFDLHEGWARFGSTEDVFHRIRASVEGRRRIRQEDEEQGNSISRGTSEEQDQQGQTKKAYEAALSLLSDMESDQNRVETSELTRAIGSALLKEEALRNMPEDVIDTLLFAEGELDSYMRSQGEMNLLRKLRVESGEWDAAPADLVRKRSRSTSQPESDNSQLRIKAKRTKAISPEEANRFLSSI